MLIDLLFRVLWSCPQQYVYWMTVMFGIAVGGVGVCGLVSLLLEAIDCQHLTEQEACYVMDLSPSQWCAQKAGQGHVSLQRIDRFAVEHREVLARWGAKMYARYGPLPDIERDAELHAATLHRKRMAKASLERDERKAVS